MTHSPDELARHTPTAARRAAAQKIFAHETDLDTQRHQTLVRPGFREKVEDHLRHQWNEPVIALRLDESAGLGFDVPGRRHDGTLEGQHRLRHGVVTAARGIGRAVGSVLYLASSAGNGTDKTPRKRQIHVSGHAGAMALTPVDAFRSAKGPWLACSPTHLALVDTGSTITDPHTAPTPRTLWETTEPHRPDLNLRTHTLTWPDRSWFTVPLHGRPEERYLRRHLDPQGNLTWHGAPENPT